MGKFRKKYFEISPFYLMGHRIMKTINKLTCDDNLAMVGLLCLYVPEDTTHLVVNNFTIRQLVANEAQIADNESWVCPGCPDVEHAGGAYFTQCSSCNINFCRDHFPEFAEDGGMCVPCRAKNPKAPAQAVVVVDPHAAVLAIEPEKEASKEPEEPASEPV
jgi:hypothetical protein